MKFKIMLLVWLIASAMSLHAQSPAWWYSRGAVDTNLNNNDFAPVTCGQLKWMATNACDEMNAYFGAGTGVMAVVSAFVNTNNYDPANVGQVKYVVQPFYDRFYELDMTNTFPANMPGYYPWGDAQSTNDYALANIGQVKYVFSFDSAKDSDGDGLSDWWEVANGYDPNDPDMDDDGLSDGQEQALGTNPNNADSDGDGLTDGWEVAHGYNPLNVNDAAPILREAARNIIIDHWKMVYTSQLAFTNQPGSTADLNDMKAALNALSEKFYKQQ